LPFDLGVQLRRRAERANDRASQDKATFLVDWNPVAVQFGLPTRDATTI
jgi:hypothetical protein